MKLIMFNDNPFRLTEAVLAGRKTQIRYVVPTSHLNSYKKFMEANPGCEMPLEKFLIKRGLAKYSIGEEVAIAQSYESLGLSPDLTHVAKLDNKKVKKKMKISELPGWDKKLWVSADFMPHSVIITSVKVEKIQDMTDEDIRKDGIMPVDGNSGYGSYPDAPSIGKTLREAYEKFIDTIYEKARIWRRNPYVYVYEFRLER